MCHIPEGRQEIGSKRARKDTASERGSDLLHRSMALPA